MDGVGLLGIVVLVGIAAATASAWRSRHIRGNTYLFAFFTAFLSMFTLVCIWNLCGPANWQQWHYYPPVNWLQWLGSFVAYKSFGLLLLAVISLAGPAVLARFRHIV